MLMCKLYIIYIIHNTNIQDTYNIYISLCKSNTYSLKSAQYKSVKIFWEEGDAK